MLIPSLIQAFEDDMKAMGMKLSADEIYSVNHSSMKDAILHFGGGCTAELVSEQGLLLTNHHCGFSQIQSHSSLENDYLKYGFWAKSKKDELANPGLTAARIVRIDDVTASVLFGTEG
ncbi:MAG: serine protease, partial [Bacteroidetes bacterium]